MKKRMRRARWKRKSLFAAQPALRASWRKCGGLPNQYRLSIEVSYRVRSTLAVVGTAPPQLAEPRQSSWGGRSQGPSFYSRAFRFAMRYPAGYRKQVTKLSATARVRQQKEDGKASGTANRQPIRNRQGAAAKRGRQGIRDRQPPISRNRQDAAAKRGRQGIRDRLPTVFRNRQGAAAKEKLRASGNTPSFRNFHMWLSGQKPASPHRAKPP